MNKEIEKLPKISEMLEDKDVIKYDDEILTLVKEYTENNSLAIESIESSDYKFLEIGKKLLLIEETIAKENGDNQVRAKKLFAAFKLRTSKKIDKNISNVDKVIKVAQFCQTENYLTYKERLPKGWGALYFLCNLTDGQITTLMEDEEINSTIARHKLVTKINAIKNPEGNKDHKVKIVIKGGMTPTNEQLVKLQRYLSNQKEFKQWQISSHSINESSTETSPDK